MSNNDHLIGHMTKLPNVPDKQIALPGMAYYAGTGPTGKTCGRCGHRRDGRCEMFRKLTGRPGPRVQTNWLSCKYFEDPPPEDLRTVPQPISKVPPT